MKIFLDALSRIPTVSIGTQALIIGCLQILHRRFPDATFVMLSSLPAHERSYLDATGYAIEYVQRSPSQWGTLRQFSQIVARVDAVASAWGDGYVTTPSRYLLQKSLAIKRAGVPLILVTASLGPFQGKLDALLARWGLARFDRLTVRDCNSQRYVAALGLSDVRCLPDTAFVVEPAAETAIDAILQREGIPGASPYIGLNPSILLHHRFPHLNGQMYADAMATLIAHLRRTTQRPILLIPHQIYPASFPGMTPEIRRSVDGDDRAAAEIILQALAQREDIYCLSGDYSPAEYKGVMQRCEMFIGGRMHSVIGAVSVGVPAVIMQYSHKASGVMEMLHLADHVWDCRDSLETLLPLVDRVWEERATVRANLANIMPGIIADAYTVGDVLADAMSRHGR